MGARLVLVQEPRGLPLPGSAQTRGLTWPQNRNGSRKVRPRHIQDWNPSVEGGVESLRGSS